MKIQPLYDRIIIKRTQFVGKTKSGIHLPPSSEGKEQSAGKVIAVGPGRSEGGQFWETTCKPGDLVIFSKFGGTEIQIDEETYVALSEKDVICILEEPKDE